MENIKVINIDCQGCSNSCPLEVTVEDGEMKKVEGNCCHRGLVSAKKQLKKRKMITLASFPDMSGWKIK